MEEKSCFNCQWRGLLVNVCCLTTSPTRMSMVHESDYCVCWEPDTRTPDWKQDTKEEQHEV